MRLTKGEGQADGLSAEFIYHALYASKQMGGRGLILLNPGPTTVTGPTRVTGPINAPPDPILNAKPRLAQINVLEESKSKIIKFLERKKIAPETIENIFNLYQSISMRKPDLRVEYPNSMASPLNSNDALNILRFLIFFSRNDVENPNTAINQFITEFKAEPDRQKMIASNLNYTWNAEHID